MAYKRYWLKITSKGVPVLGSLQHRKKAPSATNDGRWVDVTKGMGLCCIFQGVSAPANFAAANGATGQIILSWAAVPGATSYKVERSTAADFSVALTQVFLGTPLTTTDTGLTSGVRYFYRISAFTPQSGFTYIDRVAP